MANIQLPQFFPISGLFASIVGLTLVYFVIFFSTASQVQAQEVQGFYANLSGSEEVPPTESNASGYAVFLFNNESSQLSYLVNTTGLGKITAAHTHNGTTGVNGDIVVTLSEDITAKDKKNPVMWFTKDITKTDLQGPLKKKDISDLIALMSNESAYVNVHTEKYPDGAIRGQIFAAEVQTEGGVITGLQTGFGLIPLTGLQIPGGAISFLIPGLTDGGIVGGGIVGGGIVGGGDGGGFSGNTLENIKDEIDKILSTGEDTVHGVTDTASGISDDLRNNLENIKDGLDKVLSSDGGSDGGGSDGGGSDGGGSDGGGSVTDKVKDLLP